MNPRDLAALVADPEQVAQVPPERIPEAIGELERLKAQLWARLVAPPADVRDIPAGAQGDAERYLTVEQVMARLNVTRRWVLDHKRELGGFGTRKTLRFPESRVRRWEDARRR